MRSIIFLIMGLIFIGTGILVYFVIGAAFTDMPAMFGELQTLLQYGMGGLFAGIGAIMTLSGLIGVMRGAKRSKLAGHIAQTGVETEAPSLLSTKTTPCWLTINPSILLWNTLIRMNWGMNIPTE